MRQRHAEGGAVSIALNAGGFPGDGKPRQEVHFGRGLRLIRVERGELAGVTVLGDVVPVEGGGGSPGGGAGGVVARVGGGLLGGGAQGIAASAAGGHIRQPQRVAHGGGEAVVARYARRAGIGEAVDGDGL